MPIQLIVPPGVWNLTNNIFPAYLPRLFPFYNPWPVTVQVRWVALIQSGFYECWSNYDDVALGRYFPGGVLRRPMAERTTENKNICLAFILFRLSNAWLPESIPTSIDVLSSVGLNYNYTGTDPDTATGQEKAIALGNKIANTILQRSYTDGFNQLGDGNGRVYHRTNFSDTTGYSPVNDAYPNKLVDPDRWQPNFTLDPKRKPAVQGFMTPQFGLSTQTFHMTQTDAQCQPPKGRFREKHGRFYKKKADEVINAVAALTDYQKMVAEFFDNKLFGAGAISRFLYGPDDSYLIDNYMSTTPLVNIAMYEAMASIWYCKSLYDSVRPFTVIRKVYEGQIIDGWGGPRQGTVQLKAEEWNSYLITDFHPEHPSGTACLCWAFAGAAQTFLGRDFLNFTYVALPGSSVIEPGFTPQVPTTVYFDTFTTMAEICSNSRLWAGVHFAEALRVGKEVCHPIGQKVGQIHYNLVNGIEEDKK
jgi:hypothetical protein